MALILDTGVLLGALDRTDPAHDRCRALIESERGALLVPTPVLVELDYWLRDPLYQGAFLAVLRNVVEGAYTVVDLVPADYERARELCTRYADADVGFVDAAVLAIVERLDEPKLATLDRRHFALMRPRHVEALALLPE
ncbi:MAG: PIN domain-containing protein [Dehalococcoidia bacterium]|nr:PIN domain-containing protein [Dehalococcoidia bacterium]